MIQNSSPKDIPHVLPGLEEYAVPLRTPEPSSKKEERKNGHRDLYNLRLLEWLVAADLNGFPQLKPWSPTSISHPLAFHEARAYYRKHRTLKGFFVHFYIDDAKFDCVRRRPEVYIPMLKSADFIVAPDFSTYRNYPLPILMKNAFRQPFAGSLLSKKRMQCCRQRYMGPSHLLQHHLQWATHWRHNLRQQQLSRHP